MNDILIDGGCKYFSIFLPGVEKHGSPLLHVREGVDQVAAWATLVHLWPSQDSTGGQREKVKSSHDFLTLEAGINAFIMVKWN